MGGKIPAFGIYVALSQGDGAVEPGLKLTGPGIQLFHDIEEHPGLRFMIERNLAGAPALGSGRFHEAFKKIRLESLIIQKPSILSENTFFTIYGLKYFPAAAYEVLEIIIYFHPLWGPLLSLTGKQYHSIFCLIAIYSFFHLVYTLH